MDSLLQLIKLITYRITDELIINLKKIFSSVKKTLVFITILPLVYYLVKIQICVGTIYLFFYFGAFTFFHIFLKTAYIITCGAMKISIKRLTLYTIFRLLILIPRAKSFLLVYNFLSFIYKSEKSLGNRLSPNEYLLLFFIFAISMILKLSIPLLCGYSYITLLVASRFVIKLFSIIEFTYPADIKIIYQHILLNCFSDIEYSIGVADGKRIILDKSNITFNGKKSIDNFANLLTKTKNIDLLHNVVNAPILDKFKFIFYKGHYTYGIKSTSVPDKYAGVNCTSKAAIKAYNTGNDRFEYVNCIAKTKPNLKEKDEFCYVSSFYEMENFNSKELGYIKEDIVENMILNLPSITLAIALNCNEKILFSNDKRLEIRDNSCTVLDFLKKNDFEITSEIIKYSDYISINRDYFSNPEKKMELQDYVDYQCKFYGLRS